jgi:hypothetical protein
VGSGERRHCTGDGDAAAANDDSIAREMFLVTMKINDEDEIIALSPPALKKLNQVTMMSP